MGKANGLKQFSWANVSSRIVAAALGGYGLSYAFTACLTLLLPFSKSEAALTATMVSFILYTGAILWAFAASTPRRAWIGLVVPAAICAAIAVPLVWPLGG